MDDRTASRPRDVASGYDYDESCATDVLAGDTT
jgi:hypothetical protein